MLVSERTIRLNNEAKEERINKYRECEMISRVLNPVNRLRLGKINELINKLSMAIEDTTGWVYTPSCFTLKSNYQYDEEHDEITYDLNKVSRTRDSYRTSKDFTSYEVDFVSKNQEQLDRLLKLEQKRDKILDPYLRKYGTSIKVFFVSSEI